MIKFNLQSVHFIIYTIIHNANILYMRLKKIHIKPPQKINSYRFIYTITNYRVTLFSRLQCMSWEKEKIKLCVNIFQNQQIKLT
jgi:hypothetical protein